MALPPEPDELRVSLPPSILTLPSALMQVEALVLTSVLSHLPPPEVVTLISPPLTITSPSALRPLVAVAVTVHFTVPELMVMVPVSSL